MENDYYVLAHGQAAKERAEVRAQIEKLLARDVKLEKLLDCLSEFLPLAEKAAAAEHQPPTEVLPGEQHAPEHEHVPEPAGV